MRWDLFCRVVDNYGDAGVAWRLAADLASRGEMLRLWIDDPSPLAWMAPQGASGIEVLHWTDAPPAAAPGDVVIEAFGCELPPEFVAAMARRDPPTVWINLEYLSAEDYVERSHGLRSPQQFGAGAGLEKWFFYPGFTPATGGLLREPDLAARLAAFDRPRWLASRGASPRPGERVVSLFAYDNPGLDRLVARLGDAPTLLLACPGPTQHRLAGLDRPAGLRVVALPWLGQREYDELLWSADLNFVRGEDSFVRAQWAGRPFVWQVYPQHDAAHAAKLDAFLRRFESAAATGGGVEGLRGLWQAWNGLGPWPTALPDFQGWEAAARRWRDALLAQDDLAARLLRFVAARR